MSKQKKIFSFLVLVVLTTSALLLLTSPSKCPFFECQKDDSYEKACLESAIPPWPICKFKSTKDWVEKAKDGASRCCGDDMSECKCPSNETKTFKKKIGPWCEGVSKCSNATEEDAATEAFLEEWSYEKITSEVLTLIYS